MSIRLFIKLGMVSLLSANLVTPFIKRNPNNFKQETKKDYIDENILFIPDVDGSSLTENKWTYADGLQLFKNFIGTIDKTAQVILQNEKLLTKKLKKGTNLFFVKIIVGTEERLAIGRLINVRLSQQERVKELIEEINNKIDGSKLSCDITYSNIIKFANLLAHKLDDKIKITLNDTVQPDQKLKVGANQIKVNVLINGLVFSHTIILKEVKENNDLFFNEILTDLSHKTHSISKHDLTTTSTVIDGLAIIEKQIQTMLPIATVTLVNQEQKFQQLKTATVTIPVEVKIGNSSQIMNFNIKNIISEDANNPWNSFIMLQQEQQFYNNNVNHKLFKVDDLSKVNAIIEIINDQLVSGDDLTSANTFKDAFDCWVNDYWLQDVPMEHRGNEVKVTLDDSIDPDQKLQEEENYFVVRVTIGNESATATVGVSGVVLLDDDRLDLFEQHLNDEFDGSTLNTQQTYEAALSLVRKKTDGFDGVIKLKLANTKESKKKLTAPVTKMMITISSNGKKRNKEITIINIKFSNKERLDLISKNLKENVVDAATLNTSQTSQDALRVIADYVKEIDDQAIIELAQKDDNAVLVKDANEIKVIVTVGEQKEIIMVKIGNVMLSKQDRIKKVIAEVLKQDINGEALNTGQDLNKALEIVNEKVKAVDQDITVSLAKVEEGTNKLQENNNLFNVILELGDQKQPMTINVAKVKLSPTEKLQQLKEQFNNKEINASIFTTNNTISEALEKLIKPEIMRFSKNAKITVATNLETKLNVDVTEVEVTLEIEDQTEVITFKLTGIKLSDEDSVDDLITKIIAEDFIDTDLDSSQTNKDLLNIVKDKVKNIYEKANIELKDPAIADDKIKTPEDSVTYVIKIGDVSKEVTINFKNIKKSDSDRLKELFDNLEASDRDLDGSNLNTKNTHQDALEMIKEKILALDPEADVTLVDNEFFKVKDNEVKCHIKIGNESKEMTFNIKDVKLSDEERVNEIETWLLEKEFDGNGLTTNNIISDAIERILEEIKMTYPDAKITLTDTENSEEKLQEPFHVIAVKVEIEGLTVETALKIKNIVLSDTDVLERIRNQFEEMAIDGQELTTDNTNADALELIKNEIAKNDPSVTVKITDTKTLTNKLIAGENTINVTIKSGKKVQKINVKINGVKLSNGDKVKNFIETVDKNIVDQELTTDNKIGDILKIIQDKYGDSELEFSLLDNTDENEKLQENNKIKILVKLDDQEAEVEFEVGNVTVTDADLVKRISEEFNNKEVDASDLTTDNKVSDVVNDLTAKIKAIDDRAEVELLEINPNDQLKDNDNEMKFKVKINDEVQEITVKLKDIKKSKKDKLADITNALKEMTIAGDSLTTDNVVSDTLSLILDKIRDIEPNGLVQIDDQKLKQQKLKPGDNTFKVKIIFDGLEEELEVTVNNVKLSSGDLIDKAIKKFEDKKIDGSDLTTDNTKQDIVKLIQDQLNETNSEVTVELLDEVDNDKNLVKGDNEINLKIKHGDDAKLLKIVVNNVINSDQTIIDNIKKDLETQKDALLRDLTTNESIGDLIDKINKMAKVVDKDAEIVTAANLQDNLSEDENPLTFKIVSGVKETELTIDFKGVKESNEKILAKIQEKLLVVEGDSLTARDTKEKTLPIINEILKDLIDKYGIDIGLYYPNVDTKTKLKVNKDNVEYLVTINGKKYHIKAQITNIKEDPNLARLENLSNEIKDMEVDLGLLCLKPKETLINQIMEQLKQKKFTDFDEVTIEVIDVPNVIKKTINFLGIKKYNKVRVKIKVGDYEKIVVVKYAVIIDPTLCLRL